MLGQLRKMVVKLDETVGYQLPLTDERVNLNALIGRTIVLRHTGNIFCVHCGRQTKKSFNQGHCYPCFISLAQCDMCIMKPEQCHFEQGTCREPEWGEAFCMQPHFVYLAKTSGVKVGITRYSQIPIRWIDQGAVQALPIFKVKSRYLSGLIEVVLAKHVKDKTNWQRMLKNQVGDEDLIVVRDRLVAECQEELAVVAGSFSQDAIEYLDVTRDIWIEAGNLARKLRADGKTIPLSDIIIACSAKQHSYQIFTIDKHFQMIPGTNIFNTKP